MSHVVNKLNKLGLEFLDYGWVQAIFDSEFLEFEELPTLYENSTESVDLKSTFKDIMKAIDVWLSSETYSIEEKSWAFLSQQIDHKRILALLAYYIDLGCKNIITKEYRNNALLACRVYYKLLSIPGYKAYHIYHSQLFVHSLACLGFPKAMCDSENNFFNTKELTFEVNSVIKQLSLFVVDLRTIIKQLQLSPSDMNFEDILSNLVDITGGAIVNKLHVGE